MNKKGLGISVLLGSVWGLLECGLGIGLKACASSISRLGDDGGGLVFHRRGLGAPGRKRSTSRSSSLSRSAFKMFDALLLGLPIGSSAVVHPAFAFVLEGAALVGLGTLVVRYLWRSRMSRVFWGGASAFVAAAAFPAGQIRFGDAGLRGSRERDPSGLGLHAAGHGLSMLTVPLGIGASEKSLGFAARPAGGFPAAVILACV